MEANEDGRSQSAFRQLQLDAAVALVGFFRRCGIERLELGKAGGDQPLGGHAERNQVLHHRDRARGGELPVRLEQGLLVIGRTSVWPSTRSTQAISVGICLSSSVKAAASLSSSARPSGSSAAWPVSKNTSDWNTKRSPTMRMSGRLPKMARSRPKNSER